MTNRSIACIVLSFISIFPWSARAAAPTSTELGTNFWNIGWHRPDDCFRDMKAVAGDDPWNPQFLQEIKIYRVLRFMDWDVTNNSQRKSWSQRPAKTDAKQNPVAYEWMIDLCNHNDSDLWVTIPHLAISHETGDQPCDYALRLCLLVKTGVDVKDVDLKPLLERLATMGERELVAAGGTKVCEPLTAGHKLYLEYSNETWNGSFKQSAYCGNEGAALGLDKDRHTAGFRFHAWAALRLFRAADLVFGAADPRVVRVLATQSANSWIAGQHLAVIADAQLNPWKIKADAIAIAPYFGHKVDGAAPDAVAQLREAIKKPAADAEKHRKIADSAGLKLIAYEGGQHVIQNAAAINRSPEMHELYVPYLAVVARQCTVFCHYAHVGRASDRGAWGAIEQTGQPLDQSPKYRALKEFSTASSRP